MAYTTALVDGPNTLAQNTVYALPGKAKFCKSDDSLAVATTSGATFTLVTATSTTGALLPAAAFVKCTTSTTVCVLGNQ